MAVCNKLTWFISEMDQIRKLQRKETSRSILGERFIQVGIDDSCAERGAIGGVNPGRFFEDVGDHSWYEGEEGALPREGPRYLKKNFGCVCKRKENTSKCDDFVALLRKEVVTFLADNGER